MSDVSFPRFHAPEALKVLLIWNTKTCFCTPRCYQHNGLEAVTLVFLNTFTASPAWERGAKV